MTNKATDNADSQDSVGTPDPSESYSLETTLRELLEEYRDYVSTAEPQPTVFVGEILEAFKQAGWLKPEWKEGVAINVAVDGEGHLYRAMTGRVFYDRFIKELEKSVDVNRRTQDFTDAVLAARKAAGLDD